MELLEINVNNIKNNNLDNIIVSMNNTNDIIDELDIPEDYNYKKYLKELSDQIYDIKDNIVLLRDSINDIVLYSNKIEKIKSNTNDRIRMNNLK